ncbi:MAG: ATP-binding protein [Elusimicrobiaceae bacterium]|jgi:hypothetical protein|nr:ATP-binding protein [Elusimicrobiaceae bacterium]MBT3954879.1 ATP-binding protein [Elusimicrobiaceae bacterium]MBT4008374.1 ATP-binding protein [Elusimicrobiaceae bacterium]MBT4403101.1 ATP-binding protein [Elusimicrobiaceae bacterium]MBT4439445.1 ATP-binding protein [Elusimicrobiaceae bacterium]
MSKLTIRKIAFTGGPNSGKSSIIKIAKETFGEQVSVAKEAATILFAGGYPRKDDSPAHVEQAQKIIYYMIEQLEELEERTSDAKVMLCDRFTLDGFAFWPSGLEGFLKANGNSSLEKEFAKYFAIVHLPSPSDPKCYCGNNTTRTEDVSESLAIDKRIYDVCKKHPNFYKIENANDYKNKTEQVLEIITDVLKN